jgi:hypothetical protein
MSRAIEACTAPRISPLLASFTEAHILAIIQAISR